jgi:hypothetical protein
MLSQLIGNMVIVRCEYVGEGGKWRTSAQVHLLSAASIKRLTWCVCSGAPLSREGSCATMAARSRCASQRSRTRARCTMRWAATPILNTARWTGTSSRTTNLTPAVRYMYHDVWYSTCLHITGMQCIAPSGQIIGCRPLPLTRVLSCMCFPFSGRTLPTSGVACTLTLQHNDTGGRGW